MKVILNDKSGVILKTANKHCKEDIEVSIETEELTITPSIEEQVNEGLYNKVTVQAMENIQPHINTLNEQLDHQATVLSFIKMILTEKGYINPTGVINNE